MEEIQGYYPRFQVFDPWRFFGGCIRCQNYRTNSKSTLWCVSVSLKISHYTQQSLYSKNMVYTVYWIFMYITYINIYIYIVIHIFTRKTIQQFVFDNLTVALLYRRTRGIHFCQFAWRHRGCCSLGRIWRRGLWHQHRWYRWKTSWSCDSDPSCCFTKIGSNTILNEKGGWYRAVGNFYNLDKYR